jgi:hypothetical protein
VVAVEAAAAAEAPAEAFENVLVAEIVLPPMRSVELVAVAACDQIDAQVTCCVGGALPVDGVGDLVVGDVPDGLGVYLLSERAQVVVQIRDPVTGFHTVGHRASPFVALRMSS